MVGDYINTVNTTVLFKFSLLTIKVNKLFSNYKFMQVIKGKLF